MSVIDEIAAERERQMTGEGWSIEHDDTEHTNGELAAAASAYALNVAYPRRAPFACWPWSLDWWKPSTPRRDLIKAAALIVAEIERLDRAQP